MLSHLRQHVTTALQSTHRATLATNGPAGLQAQVVPCAASGLQLFLLLPRTSEHLLNLEQNPAAVVATEHWQVSGNARIATAAECPAALLRTPDASWSEVVIIRPTRVSIAQRAGWGAVETIDLE
jgi:hypothetical protein